MENKAKAGVPDSRSILLLWIFPNIDAASNMLGGGFPRFFANRFCSSSFIRSRMVSLRLMNASLVWSGSREVDAATTGASRLTVTVLGDGEGDTVTLAEVDGAESGDAPGESSNSRLLTASSSFSIFTHSFFSLCFVSFSFSFPPVLSAFRREYFSMPEAMQSAAESSQSVGGPSCREDEYQIT